MDKRLESNPIRYCVPLLNQGGENKGWSACNLFFVGLFKPTFYFLKTTVHNKSSLKTIRQKLRNNSTKAEKLLWKFLKQSQLDNRKFRRQHSIGNYVVDFYCPQERLIVELDGEVHDIAEVKDYDKYRENNLSDMKFKIIRIKNEEVFEDIEKVMEKIKDCFSTTP